LVKTSVLGDRHPYGEYVMTVRESPIFLQDMYFPPNFVLKR